MRRLDSEKVIESLSTLGLDAKETITSQKLRLKFDKLERLYGPENPITANADKFAEAQDAFEFLKSNIYNVNLLIQNNFNEEDYEIALQQVEEQQIARQSGEKIKRQINRENQQVEESVLKAREAAAAEAAQEYYISRLDLAMEPYKLSYSEYSKKGNDKIKNICEKYKNVVTNIKNTDEAKDKLLELKNELNNILKRSEEKGVNKKIILYSAVLLVFLLVAFLMPVIVNYSTKQANQESYEKAIGYMKDGNFSDARSRFVNLQNDMDVAVPLRVCDGVLILYQSSQDFDEEYIIDGITTIISTGTKVNVYYDYSYCKLKSLLTDIKAFDTSEDEYKGFYTPTIYGYAFKGWKLTKIVYDGDVNITLTAQLTLIKYNIEYDLNGGYMQYSLSAYSNPNSYTVESNITLITPFKDGFMYSCWLDELGNVVKTITPGTIGNKVLTAYYYN